jgi:hypothetical protein
VYFAFKSSKSGAVSLNGGKSTVKRGVRQKNNCRDNNSYDFKSYGEKG